MVDELGEPRPVPGLAEAIIGSVREPLLVLDGVLSVTLASRSFSTAFGITAKDTIGHRLYDLGERQFDILPLRLRLEQIMSEPAAMDGFELTAKFLGIGQRTLTLNARKLHSESASHRILLGFEDITDRRVIEQERESQLRQTEVLLQQKDILLREMQHRVANSLQIIASILLLKALSVTSLEARGYLQDAHRRVLSIAAVQQQIQSAGRDDLVEMAPYLTKLCASLGASMIADEQTTTIKVHADHGTASSVQAVSLGLIVTELVINSLKHAFPRDHPDAQVVVRYETSGSDWQLVVSDNGVGRPIDGASLSKGGLGTTLVKALAQQLGCHIESTSGPSGVSITMTRATFVSRLPPTT
jgi:two-component sensor histidine kinase